MALNKVNPGDLITAAQWNALVDAVSSFSGVAVTGPVTVPSVFGFTLTNAVALLTLPSTQLVVGSVIDSLGNRIDPNQPSSKSLIVLNQMPQAGTGVQPETSLNLVVTPVAGSAPPPPPQPPIISAFATVQPVPITQTVEIDGQNFDPAPGNNQVTFAGVQGTVGGTSNRNQLFVSVPTGIPGAPTTAGQTLSVPVVVTTPAGASSPSNLSITAPPSTPVPTITNIAPTGGQAVGNSITITGTNFDGTTPGNNSVIFLNITATPTNATSTQLVVTVPAGINGLNKAGDNVNIGIIVQTNGQQSLASSPYSIVRLT